MEVNLTPNDEKKENNFDVKKTIKRFLISSGLFLLEMVKIAVLAGVTIGLIRYFLFKPFYVKGASMEPTFFESEYLIIDELSYRLHDPARGDVIVFKYPENPQEYFLKRIIGLPGETVKVSGGKVTIFNTEHPEGVILDETYLPDDLATEGEKTVKISDTEYFVMGDNRPNSYDSRRFGSVDRSLIVGRAWLRGWPVSRAGVITTPSTNISTTE